MRTGIPDFKARTKQEIERLGQEGGLRLLDAGRAWDLAPTLRAGGAIIFPHATIHVCGHQIAAAVHACLDSGAGRVLALGVLHALTDAMQAARVRVAEGGDPAREEFWGIQGPGLDGRQEWRAEFSMLNFHFLWETELQRRGIRGPELIVRYPYLAGGRPQLLPGIGELREIAQDAVVVATMDPFHHGIAYGEPPETALAPEAGGLDLARQRIEEGLALLKAGDDWAYNRHCVEAKSDGRDVGQVLRHLLGPLEGRVLDVVADDMTGPYNQPAPSWVAGALIALWPIEHPAQSLA
jgi:hypothetical protein